MKKELVKVTVRVVSLAGLIALNTALPAGARSDCIACLPPFGSWGASCLSGQSEGWFSCIEQPQYCIVSHRCPPLE